MSVLDDAARVEAMAVLARFRTDFYGCLTARADALFELTDALLCTDGAVKTLVELALAPEHRRGHGGLYDGLNCGRIEVDRLRATLAGLPSLRTTDGRIVLAVDVSPWLRADAPTSAERLFCHGLRAGQEPTPADPGLALLRRGRPGERPHLLDRGAGRGPPQPPRRRHRGHRRPAPRRRRPPDRGRPLAPG